MTVCCQFESFQLSRFSLSRDIIYAFDFIAKLLRLPVLFWVLPLRFALAFGVARAQVVGRSDFVEFTLQVRGGDDFAFRLFLPVPFVLFDFHGALEELLIVCIEHVDHHLCDFVGVSGPRGNIGVVQQDLDLLFMGLDFIEKVSIDGVDEACDRVCRDVFGPPDSLQVRRRFVREFVQAIRTQSLIKRSVCIFGLRFCHVADIFLVPFFFLFDPLGRNFLRGGTVRRIRSAPRLREHRSDDLSENDDREALRLLICVECVEWHQTV